MARSIHDTWGVMERATRADWADADIPLAIEAEMWKNVRRQRAIREGERRLRRRGAKPPPPVHPDQVPILVDDEAPYIFHPASEEDVRAILRRLPPGSLDGLQAIRLCVDSREVRGASAVRDPFTGRRRHELIPGVYTSCVLGTYSRQSATIRLHAYLCEPHVIAPFALHFKLEAFKVLLHEAGHHFDLTFRVGRSRWDVGDRDKEEAWASRSEEDAVEIARPYVLERYSAECSELQKWIEVHAGTPLPPVAFLHENSGLSLRRPFLALVRSVLAGHDRDVTRVAFARALHRIGANDSAGKVVRAVLANRPDDPGALAVSACIAQCKDRDFDTAESLCLRAIAGDPTCLDARDVLVRCYAMQGQRERTALACEQALSVIPAGDTQYGECILETLVESHLLLDDFCRADADVARMRAWGTEDAALSAEVYGVIARCWAKQWEDALLLASRLLLTGKYEEWELWLAAVRFECAHRLGRPQLAGAFHEAHLAKLKSNSFTRTWAQRLRALIEMGAS